jgi:TonB family protein
LRPGALMKKVLSMAWILSLCASALAADQDRKLLATSEPEYPAIARNMNLHGAVKLKIWISSDGKVNRVEYIGGHPVLAESALKAVKTWRYESSAKETTTIVELKF